MKLAEYIKDLQELYEQEGDLTMFTASDPEGNSYNKVYYSPEVRVVADGEEDEHRLDYVFPPFDPEENTWKDYCEEYGVDEEIDPTTLKRVILL